MPFKSSSVYLLVLILIVSATASAQVTLNTVPSRELGQPILPKPDPFAITTSNPNLVEGREFYNPFGIAVDTGASPPILYVADTNNNRILAWKNASSFANGKAADLIIGQKDSYSTGQNGPGITSVTTGLNAPTGLAVLAGDLYVADTQNNRVMRFRAPFSAPAGQQLIPDLCLGQPSFSSRAANAPTGQQSEKGLAAPGALRFDRSGNLWVADAGNNRVLEYLASDISRPATPFNISAKLEIGQLDFISKQPALPNTDAGRQTVNQLASPTAINFDSAGRLYIADFDSNLGPLMSRVLVFEPPFTNGMSARRIMGVLPALPAGSPARTDPQIYSVAMNGPSDIFFLPGTQGIGILDSGFHRILLFDSYDNWPDPATAFSPSAKAVIGHASGINGINSHDLKSLVSNDGNAQGLLAGPATFSLPQAAAFFNNELYVADTGNNRVIVMPFANGTFQSSARLLGQDRFDSNAPNLIEGKEFDFTSFVSGQFTADAGLAVDSTTSTPHLYVSDPYNNRVLGFRDIRSIAAGKPADIVIGQPDFATNLCNYPTGDPTTPQQNSLCRPTGLLVDGAGNLYVADSRNNRVLRFPTPFSHLGNQVADLVLGQSSFFTKVTDPSASTMGLPYGLAFAGSNGLLVSDQAYNRVLFIPFTNGGFTSADNGKAATKVLGQLDFTTIAASNLDTGMNGPKHIAADTDGRPYVIDGGNRVLIFDQITRQPNGGAHAAVILPVNSSITSIFVNSVTGEVLVGDYGNRRIVKYPKFDTLIFNPAPTSTTFSSLNPLAVVQDQYGDMIVAEAVNRVTFYYPGLSAVNGANFVLGRGLAPNAFATLFPTANSTFGKDTQDIGSLPNPIPLPNKLADVQVLWDGAPCPLYYAGPTQINLLVPWGAATSGLADVQVMSISTGQTLAAGLVPMNQVSPAVFTGAKVGATTVQAAVINQDGVPNSPTHPAARGEIISIYATGQGFITGAPADGALPSSPLSTDSSINLRIGIGACLLDTCPVQAGEKVIGGNFLQYSGTSFYPGLWQINVQIPQAPDPTVPAPITLNVNGIPGNGAAIGTPIPVIYVKAQ